MLKSRKYLLFKVSNNREVTMKGKRLVDSKMTREISAQRCNNIGPTKVKQRNGFFGSKILKSGK